MTTAPVARALASTARLYADLEHAVTVTTQSGGQRVGSTGHRTYPMPVNVAASDARVRLQKALRSAAFEVYRAVWEDTSRARLKWPYGPVGNSVLASLVWGGLDTGPRRATPTGCAAWLLSVHIVAPAYLEPVVDDLLAVYGAARAQAYPQDTAPTPAREADTGAALVTRIKADSHFATAAEIESLTAVTGERIKATTVRSWASRRKLTAVEIQGRTVYRLGDALRLARERDERAAAA